MAITYGFFDSQNGDRKYNAKQLGEYFNGLISNGVYYNIGQGLKVSLNNKNISTDKSITVKVNVASGRAYINGHWLYNDGNVVLILDSVASGKARTDAIVVRLSEELREIDIIVKKGSEYSGAAPTIETNENTYELVLAYVVIGITHNITIQDMRSSSACGWVTGLIKQVDLSKIVPDLQSAYNSLSTNVIEIKSKVNKSLYSSGTPISGPNAIAAYIPDLNAATENVMFNVINNLQSIANIPPTTADAGLIITFSGSPTSIGNKGNIQFCSTDNGLYYRFCPYTENTEQWTEWINLLSSADSSELIEQISQNTTDIAAKLNKPSSDGTAGMVLQSNGDGTTAWGEAITEIEDGTITPLKTSFFVKSDIEYEIIEGKKLNANNIVADDNAFTVFIKIPDKAFAWISVTPSNTTYPFGSGTRTSGSLICDTNKQSLGSYGFTDNNRNLCVLRGDKVKNHDGAAYFAVSYTLGTEFDIKIGGIDTHNDNKIPVSQTELSNDFFVSGKNLINDTDAKVQYAPSNDRWTYQGSSTHNITNFFEVQNNTTYYHNGSYVYLELFDEQYNYVGSIGNFASGTVLQKDYDFKYAYAWSTTSTGIKSDFWFADTDLSRDTYTPNKVVNPKYVDLNNIKCKQIKNWYNGKRVSFLGDSLTDNGTGGFYINYLNEYFGFSAITKSAKGGTFVSGDTTAFGAAFWQDDRVNQLDLDSDIVFVMGGTNDANNNVPLGDPDISNCDTKTFYGAYHVLISKLIYKYYKLDTGYYSDIDYSGVTQADTAKPVQIFLITPPYMLNSESQYNKTPAYAEAVIEIGKLLGCPVCDIRADSGVNLYAKEYYKGYRNGNYDYTHVSPEAHKQWTKVIIGKMLEVEPLESEEEN